MHRVPGTQSTRVTDTQASALTNKINQPITPPTQNTITHKSQTGKHYDTKHVVPYQRIASGKLSNVNVPLEEVHAEAPSKVCALVCMYVCACFPCCTVWSMDGWMSACVSVRLTGWVASWGLCLHDRFFNTPHRTHAHPPQQSTTHSWPASPSRWASSASSTSRPWGRMRRAPSGGSAPRARCVCCGVCV